jgi:hypothetical protein
MSRDRSAGLRPGARADVASPTVTTPVTHEKYLSRLTRTVIGQCIDDLRGRFGEFRACAISP